jgi:proteasome lid subunit RPN8/RPN11
MAPAAAIRVPHTVRQAVIDQARAARPRECCGLLVGYGADVLFAYPVRNVAASTVRYEVDPKAHIDLRRVLRRAVPSLRIVGVYHSHPAGPPVPSAADIDEALYGGWIHLIVGLAGGRAQLAAYRIQRGRVEPLTLTRPAPRRS